MCLFGGYTVFDYFEQNGDWVNLLISNFSLTGGDIDVGSGFVFDAGVPGFESLFDCVQMQPHVLTVVSAEIYNAICLDTIEIKICQHPKVVANQVLVFFILILLRVDTAATA